MQDEKDKPTDSLDLSKPSTTPVSDAAEPSESTVSSPDTEAEESPELAESSEPTETTSIDTEAESDDESADSPVGSDDAQSTESTDTETTESDETESAAATPAAEAEAEPETESKPDGSTENEPDTETETESEPESETTESPIAAPETEADSEPAEDPVPPPAPEVKPEQSEHSATVPSISDADPEPAQESESPAKTEAAESPIVSTQDEPSVAPQVITSNPKRKGKTWMMVLLLIIILGAVGVGAYLYLNHHKTTSTAKKDIPVITYGLADEGPSAAYPNSLNTGGAAQVNSQLYEGLVGYQDLSKIKPLLATSWVNPDNNDWVFTLRPNVKFHSGRTMTAADVKYSLDYAVQHQNDQDSSLVVELASTIKSVTVIDSSHVKITTDGPDPTLLNRLTWLYVIDSKAKLGDPDAGTGPYIIKPGTTPTPKHTQLAAIDNYWGGHVYTRAIDFQTVSDPTQLGQDTASGKFDIAGQISSTDMAKLKNATTVNVQGFYVYFLGLNTLRSGSPLTSTSARQAIAYAMDVPAILKAGGLVGQQVSQLIPPSIPGYDSSISNTPYNPTKAKQLLASVPNATAQINLVYPSSREAIVTEITKELTAVGFNVKATSEPDVGTVVKLGLSGKTDAYFLGYSSDIFDGLDIIQSVITGNDNYSNAQVDALTKQASSTLDPTTRISLLQKIEKQAATDEPNVPLYGLTDLYALTKPYHLNVDIPGTHVGAYFWQVYQ